MASKCTDHAAALPLSNAKAKMVHSTVPVMHIKAVRESLAGYAFSVNAYKKKNTHYVTHQVILGAGGSEEMGMLPLKSVETAHLARLCAV